MTKYSEYDYVIGVDTGVHTGICVYNPQKKEIIILKTTMIHFAMKMVSDYAEKCSILVRIEDARLRKWYGNNAYEKRQGAGSIKRDAKIWEDYLKSNEIPFELVNPKDNKTKTSKLAFKKITGFQDRASVHARDSAMLVWGL